MRPYYSSYLPEGGAVTGFSSAMGSVALMFSSILESSYFFRTYVLLSLIIPYESMICTTKLDKFFEFCHGFYMGGAGEHVDRGGDLWTVAERVKERGVTR